MPGDDRVGTVLAGKYRLDEELGRGGMGAVYRAFHLRVHKEFAVKLLLKEVAGHRTVAQRFFLEAQAAGRIGHPGILDVYDVGEDENGTPFIVMELLRGDALASVLRRVRLDVSTACWVASQILLILEAAHAAGVVHRDVKPQNVFLCHAADATRTVKLLDFGIAKFASSGEASAITRTGEIIGSPLYMAPEQATGELDVDPRVDVWSVGAMLYEMLTGTAAHAASTPVAVLAKILTKPAAPPSESNPSIAPDLDAIVLRALSIDRAARFQTAREMRDALDALRAARSWGDAPPKFTRDLALLDSERQRAAGALAPTVEAPSVEPALEAAVTKEPKPARTKPWLIPAAFVVLLAAAIVPWVVSSTKSDAVLPASSLVQPPALPSSEPPPSSAPVAEPAAVSAQDASAAPAASSVAAPVSKPQCAAGEVLSSGHCCPRGLVWKAGRCERPLATSF